MVYDNTYLERTDKEFENPVKLDLRHSRYGIGHLQVLGDWLYYTREGISRIKTDGSQDTLLYKGGVTDLYVTHDWIYFIDYKAGYHLYRMDHNGKQFECINESKFWDLLYENGQFYGTIDDDNKGCLVLLNMDGEIIETIKKGVFADYMIKRGNVIYYRNSKNLNLCRINVLTKEIVYLATKEMSGLALDKDYMYITERDDREGLGDSRNIYRVDFEAYQFELLEDETLRPTGSINMMGDYLYVESDFKENPFGVLKLKKDGSFKEVLFRY